MNDLELLREMFKDTRLHIGIGTISQLGLSNDGSILRVKVNLLPENREVIAEMGWEDVSIVSFPTINDLVLVASVDGHPDETFVIKQITTKGQPIPTLARSGHLVSYARQGKKAYYGSDTKVSLAKPDHEGVNPLVLGDILQGYLGDEASAFSALFTGVLGILAAAAGAPDFVTFKASVAALTAPLTGASTALGTAKGIKVDSPATNLLSQLAFTERGI